MTGMRNDPSPPTPPPGHPGPLLVLVRDLMFVGRINASARAAGAEIKVIRDPEKLAGEAGRGLIVDLNLSGAIPAAAAWKQSSPAGGGCVVGFVSHVDTATINEARGAGVDRVVARSAFVQLLPDLLTPEAPEPEAGPPGI